MCVSPSLDIVNIFLLCSDGTEPNICTVGELDVNEKRLWENVYQAALPDLHDNATFSTFFSIRVAGLEMVANNTNLEDYFKENCFPRRGEGSGKYG